MGTTLCGGQFLGPGQMADIAGGYDLIYLPNIQDELCVSLRAHTSTFFSLADEARIYSLKNPKPPK